MYEARTKAREAITCNTSISIAVVAGRVKPTLHSSLGKDASHSVNTGDGPSDVSMMPYSSWRYVAAAI